MKVTLKLTDKELSDMKIGEKGIDGLSPITLNLEHIGLPNVPKKATQVFMDGNMTVAYVPQIKYAEITRMEEVDEAIQQIQTFLDEHSSHYKISDASEKLEAARDLIREVLAE